MAIGRFSILSRGGAQPQEAPAPSAEPAKPVVEVSMAETDAIALRQRLLDAKLRIHGRIIDEINLATIEKIPLRELRPQIHALVAQHVASERLVLNATEFEQFVDDVLNEMTGLGPIEPLLKDESVNDILINTHRQIYVERRGVLELSDARFKDEAHLLRIINKIVSTVGRRVDESQPLCDARLLDGSRVNVAIKPVAVDGPLVSIRKFSKRPYSM